VAWNPAPQFGSRAGDKPSIWVFIIYKRKGSAATVGYEYSKRIMNASCRTHAINDPSNVCFPHLYHSPIQLPLTSDKGVARRLLCALHVHMQFAFVHSYLIQQSFSLSRTLVLRCTEVRTHRILTVREYAEISIAFDVIKIERNSRQRETVSWWDLRSTQ
jgi:hypothetical protein